MSFRWINSVSCFNSAIEALAVNEVNGLFLKEYKFGLQIEVQQRSKIDRYRVQLYSKRLDSMYPL